MDSDELHQAASVPLFHEEEWAGLCRRLRLSDRQASVLGLLLKGQTDQQIAITLGVTPPTIRSHLQCLFRQLGVNDRTSLVVIVFKVFRHGLGGQ